MMYDILIENAKTRKTGKEQVSIGIQDGKIAAIGKDLAKEAKQVIDAKGGLVTESFVNGHLHLNHQRLTLFGEGAGAPVEVESHFADGTPPYGRFFQHLANPLQLFAPLGVFVNRGGVYPNRGMAHVGIGANRLKQSSVAVGVHGGQDNLAHTGCHGSLYRFASVAVEIGIVQMRVCIDVVKLVHRHTIV